MNEKIIVSIIIVNYNSFALLQNCLESIIHHSHDINYELIVVDNNSNEGSIENIISKYNGIKLIKNKENFGFAKANNQGAEIAQGKYLFLLNNDTVLIENSIKHLYDFAESSSEMLIGSKLLNSDRTLQPSSFTFLGPHNLFTSNFFLYKLFPKSKIFNKSYLTLHHPKNAIETDVVIGAAIFIKRESFLNLKGFDERFFFYHEDSDLCYRYKKTIGKVIYLPTTSIIHFGGSTANKDLWFNYRNRSISVIKFLQKHYNGIQFTSSIFFHFFGLLVRIPIFFAVGLFTLNKKYFKRSFYNIRLMFLYPHNEFKTNV